ncbi:hypothetical protein [Pseudomonas sp.]|jgi:hypothetical protein|uniref:hypothetical protein n=1 Tax=Pseudomonas sp. TaxID=306 RepID=UPI0028AA0270|nr:hypothetical protein [Pseudomonas sp.]
MESKLSLPTDNFYKLLALLSLVGLISSFMIVIYATNTSNAIAFENWAELEVLKTKENPNIEQSTRLKILEKKIDVAVADRKTYVEYAGFLAALCTLGMFVGFGCWYRKIQPLADQLAATQLEMARLQLLSLRADLKAKGVEVDTP